MVMLKPLSSLICLICKKRHQETFISDAMVNDVISLNCLTTLLLFEDSFYIFPNPPPIIVTLNPKLLGEFLISE